MEETMEHVYSRYKENMESIKRGANIYQSEIHNLLDRAKFVFDKVRNEMTKHKEVSIESTITTDYAALQFMIPKTNYRLNLRVNPFKCIFSYHLYYDFSDKETGQIRPKISFTGTKEDMDCEEVDDFKDYGTSECITEEIIYQSIVAKFKLATGYEM